MEFDSGIEIVNHTKFDLEMVVIGYKYNILVESDSESDTSEISRESVLSKRFQETPSEKQVLDATSDLHDSTPSSVASSPKQLHEGCIVDKRHMFPRNCERQYRCDIFNVHRVQLFFPGEKEPIRDVLLYKDEIWEIDNDSLPIRPYFSNQSILENMQLILFFLVIEHFLLLCSLVYKN